MAEAEMRPGYCVGHNGISGCNYGTFVTSGSLLSVKEHDELYHNSASIVTMVPGTMGMYIQRYTHISSLFCTCILSSLWIYKPINSEETDELLASMEHSALSGCIYFAYYDLCDTHVGVKDDESLATMTTFIKILATP